MAFDKMITLAKEIGVKNPLYIDTVKELAGHSLADLKNALTAIDDARLSVFSAAEPDYNFCDFMTAIEVLETLEPGCMKNRKSIGRVTMSKFGVEM